MIGIRIQDPCSAYNARTYLPCWKDIPTEEIDDAGTDGADTGVTSLAPLFIPWLLDGTLQQRQVAFDRANHGLHAVLNLATDRPKLSWWQLSHATSAVPVATGRKRSRNWSKNYLRVTDETIRALQAALAATIMGPDDPDN